MRLHGNRMPSLRTLCAVLLTGCIVACLYPTNSYSQSTLAFPSAEGFGRFSTGGRGGRACHVNSLSSSSGSGGSCNAGGCGGSAPFSAGTVTFRDCVSGRLDAGPRTVIFRVGGTIDFGTTGYNPFATPSFLTVAGQTAPGTGIMILGLGWIFPATTHDVIVRHLRFRGNVNTFMQLLGTTDGGHDLIFDHLSAGWNTDDSLWCSYGSYNCTFQWTLQSEGMLSTFDDYNKASLISSTGASGGVSMLHNFYAQYQNRVPWQQGSTVQFINNLVYNVGDASAIFANDFAGQPPRADWENNYYRTGPQQPDGTRVGLALASSCYPPTSGCTQQGVDYAAASQIYLSGNYQNITRPNNSYPEDAFVVRWYSGETLKIVATKPSLFPTIPSMVAAASVPSRLDNVGAYAGLPQGRDALDTRAIASFTNNTGGTLNCGGVVGTATCCSNGQCGMTGVYTTGTPYPDSDGDGMSDAWETSHGLNPNDPSDGPLITASGYSNLELFINALAGEAQPLVGERPLPAPTHLRVFATPPAR